MASVKRTVPGKGERCACMHVCQLVLPLGGLVWGGGVSVYSTKAWRDESSPAMEHSEVIWPVKSHSTKGWSLSQSQSWQDAAAEIENSRVWGSFFELLLFNCDLQDCVRYGNLSRNSRYGLSESTLSNWPTQGSGLQGRAIPTFWLNCLFMCFWPPCHPSLVRGMSCSAKTTSTLIVQLTVLAKGMDGKNKIN